MTDDLYRHDILAWPEHSARQHLEDEVIDFLVQA